MPFIILYVLLSVLIIYIVIVVPTIHELLLLTVMFINYYMLDGENVSIVGMFVSDNALLLFDSEMLNWMLQEG
jgi:hypothetical protein